MKKNRQYVSILIILILGIFPLLGFISMKEQIESLRTEIQTLKSDQEQIESLKSDIQRLKDDQTTMDYNQQQLIQAVDNFLNAWQVEPFENSNYSPDEVLMLATAIDNEARNQPYLGKLAVGAVVMNRVESQGRSISEVILSPGQFCKLRYIGNQLLPDSLAAAKEAIKGVDPTGGALYFYNPRTAESKWIKGRPVLTKIGDHVFAI